MRVLLLSISPNKKSGNRQRTDYLAEAIRMAGHEAIIVRWDAWNESPTKKDGSDQTVTLRLLPTATRFFPSTTPVWNQVLVRERLSRVVKKLNIDMVIWPNNWYVIGYPPDRFRVPICIDYFDLLSDEMEQIYFSSERIALCTSNELQRRAHRWTKAAYWIPTPIDTTKFKYTRREAKRMIGLGEDTFVVSLIGLTASPELYFIDAVDRLDMLNIKCFLVGGGELLQPLRRKISGALHPERFNLLGKVDYSEVPKYFCATDVGLYPGEDHDYYHSACPIKVLEYSASGAAVVSNELRELQHWNFPNVYLAAPSSEGFHDAILRAADQPDDSPTANLDMFSLKNVSVLLDGIVKLACS
jgi:hypothetical protein